MLPSPSDKTKWFLVYCAILLVAVCNIFVGQDWAATTGPVKLTARAARDSYSPFAPAQTVPADAAGMQPDGNAPGILQSDTFRADGAAHVNEPAAPAVAETPQPKCDVAACAAAYRTFTASDCTYAPSVGVGGGGAKGAPPPEIARRAQRGACLTLSPCGRGEARTAHARRISKLRPTLSTCPHASGRRPR
jgi:hypothetical protein